MTERPTVLVADDSRTVRAAIRKYLSSHFEVLEAEDGEAAWALLTENPRVQLVVTDIQMPRLDGYGFICRIRAANDPKLRNYPIVVITSAEDEISRERAYACGANDFILKPLEFSDLVPRLQSQIEASLEGRSYVGEDMQKYDSAIEDAVLAAPDISQALRILKGEDVGSIDPHIIDLCLEAMPLFEYLAKVTSIDISEELATIKPKLEANRW